MPTKIQKWGKTQGILVSRQTLKDAHMEVGDTIEVKARKGIIIITPARRVHAKKSLQELVSRIPRKYKPGEADWGEPVGMEVW